ncbi:spermidine/putrescine transport system substrate-binding protein [Desulfonatronum thiosulfatophilum]|uniref:Spermidine/putrescine transport system substrate-binding protein n=1 Tax=Desulfonatronum thiosulfatophilum TaxID=617002 RepID=A0A1G6A3U0_9BACT|nr:spermidine/putrescine ABC transporter substrate-binding protein [Desulfonatronum thiosulfatophilum]SDB03107.1 spermidine/putrescine transport system substrate-binding protein [Desulfonatronum thiosulfatophilum]
MENVSSLHDKSAMSRQLLGIVAICWIGLLLLAGCGEQGDHRVVAQTVEVEKPRLVLYNWEEYMGEETLWKFEQATGIEVEERTYEDEEEVLGALQSGSLNADLIILSSSTAREMAGARLLSPLDMDLLPNLRHLDPQALVQDKPMNQRYHVPYLMGYTGVAVDTRHYHEPPDSWRVLWDSRLKGKMAMLNNPFEVIGAASMMLGYPLNPEMEHMEAIREALLEQKPLLVDYLHDTAIMHQLGSGDLWAAQSYSSDALRAMEENPYLQFGFPEEGCTAWVDVFVLPLMSRNPEAAHAFIDFVHTPEIMAEIASELWSATPNLAAREFMDPEVLNSPVVHPPANIMDKCYYFGNLGDPETVGLRMKLWAELLAGM